MIITTGRLFDPKAFKLLIDFLALLVAYFFFFVCRRVNVAGDSLITEQIGVGLAFLH